MSAAEGTPPKPATRWPTVLLAGGWLLAGTVLQLLRQRGAPAVDTVWAEDGNIWMSEAWAEGPFAAFPEPYAGYFHALPRVLGGLVSLLPIKWTAAVLAILSAAIVASLSLFVFVQSEELFESWWARAGLAVLVVVPPPGVWETTANITNLQWNLLAPCLWALLVAPRTRARAIAATVIGVTAALSAPVSLVLVPLAGWAWLRWPKRRGSLVGGAFLAAAAVQVSVILFQETTRLHATHLIDLGPRYGLRVGAGLVLGEPGLVRLWPGMGFGLALIGGAVVTAIGLGALADRRRRVPLLLTLAASGAMFAVPVYLRGTSLLTPQAELVLNGSKWVLGPLLLLATVALAIADSPPSRRILLRLALRGVVVAALVFSVVTSYSAFTDRSEGPRWSRAVSAGAEQCSGAANVQIDVAPPSFFAILPCHRLIGGADSSPGGVPQSP